MKLVATSKCPLHELVSHAGPGSHILLYEGEWDYWEPHPEGVVIQRGNRLLLNGVQLLYRGPWDYWGVHPEGVVIGLGDKLLLNGDKLLYEGIWDGWEPHPEGIVIRRGNQLILYSIPR